MSFYFDQEHDKSGTNSVKWEYIYEDGVMTHGDHAHRKHGSERLLPMFVADMDFRTVPEVIEALGQRAAHGVFGYATPDDCYFEALGGWFSRHYGWQIQPEWVEVTPGIVATLNMMVQQFSKPGDKILIQRPVYHPFSHAIENNGRHIISNTLIKDKDGRYTMDFEDLAQKTADPDCTMAILCSPHNPVGRVWSREELERFGQICIDNDVLIISDEIHCDLIMPGETFHTFANLNDDFAQHSITCTAPSKTFNLAGLKTSNIVIPNPKLLEGVQEAIARNGLYGKNVFGLVAAQTAYTHGDSWLTAVLDYIHANYQIFVDAMPEPFTVSPLEGTYLAWVDFNALGLEQSTLVDLMKNKAGLLLNSGDVFGDEGTGFMRFNLACHRHIVEEAMERLNKVLT